MDFLILPHQLFDKKYLDKNNKFHLYEHPQYFTKYKFNQKKLILHRASMIYYYDYLKKNNFNIKYYDFDEKPQLDKYKLFNPIDKIKLPGEYELLDSPNFLLNNIHHEAYRKKTDKFMFTGFYMWSKKTLNIYPTLKSKDSMNRERYKDDIDIPDLPNNKSDNKYINSAILYVKKHFPKNYGNVDNFIYPVTHSTAKKWLKNFISKRFKFFGSYQDFVKKGENYMFHSVLSSSINIGLINPLEIIEEIKKVKGKIPINSFEGYLRQLFWREYQVLTYKYADFTGNYLGNRKKLNKDWYNGTLGIEPIDELIKDGFDTAYMHHIGRLMFVGNFMNLSEIHPKEGFKWFMEFSIDSYEWVMHQNVLDMVFFVTGGKTMRKPYISSSNYILKMSNYKKGEWSEEWDRLYNKFIKKNKKKLWKFRYSFPTLKNM
jgi:deoxyribodipyrimidine photolyase-related protein